MDTKKIEAWANKLLDVGKRNNLINFKDSKSSSLEVVFPDVETIFAKIESSYEYEVFNPKLTGSEENEGSKFIYHAPILLSPISFRNDSAISPYYIKMSEDE